MRSYFLAYRLALLSLCLIAVGASSGVALGRDTQAVDVNLSCSGSDDTAAIMAALAAPGEKSIVIGGGQTCAFRSSRIPNLRIEPGGLLKPLTGEVVTLTGAFRAGPYRVFTNAFPGQGTISFAGASVEQIFTEWWGALPDGVTDCTAAFNAAIASLPKAQPGVNGGTVKLLAGNYLIKGITITDQQVHLVGSGGPGVLGSSATSTTFLSSTTNAPILKYNTSSEVYSLHSRLENLTVLGSVSAGTSQVGVWVDNNGILMNNVGIEKTGSHGLYITCSSVGGYSNLEINSMKGDGIRIDFSASGYPQAGAHDNIFHRISIGGTGGDGVRIMHGNGNLFYGIDIENSVGDGAGAGAGIHIYYPGDGKLEPQNNFFYGVWNENNVVGDFIGSAAQNNYVNYVHYSSPPPVITGNNGYRSAADINKPSVDRTSYLLLGRSETPMRTAAPNPKAPIVTLGRGPGLTGKYSYKVTFETLTGETSGGTQSLTVNPSNQMVHLSEIPLGPEGTLRRNIYRTSAGGPDGTQRFLATLNDNTTTIFDDSLPDSGLGRNLPVYNGSAARIVLDGEGAMAQIASSAQTPLISSQVSDPKWPSYGFLARPGFGMFMENPEELSFVASTAPNPARQLRLMSSGVTDAVGGLSVGSGSVIRKYLSASASVDFAAWAGSDCQERAIPVTGASAGDVVVLGMSDSLAAIPEVVWFAWVSASDTVRLRGCKVSSGRSIDPPPSSVRVSVLQQ
jgi:hypothetical protein